MSVFTVIGRASEGVPSGVEPTGIGSVCTEQSKIEGI